MNCPSRQNPFFLMFSKAFFVISRCRCMLAGMAWSSSTSEHSSVAATVLRPTGYDSQQPGSTCDKFSWLQQYGPCFQISGENVLVLNEPTQFYEVLKVMTKKAKRRITFASLYLGTGPLEKELVGSMEEACVSAASQANKEFKVRVLLDMTRGSRGAVNSRTMLLRVLNQFPDYLNVSLYHTPDLRGLMKRLVPERFNEVIGLTHLKVYLVDDSLIISGANLSNDYFTNRQDRYVLFNDCKDMADFFDDLVAQVSSFSFQLHSDNSVSLHQSWDTHPFQGDKNVFRLSAKEKITALLNSYCTDQKKSSSDELRQAAESQTYTVPATPQGDKRPDTRVYPLVQMGPFDILYDEHATLRLLQEASKQDEILLASGYFNLTDHYLYVILQESRAKFQLLMAAPEVNGFFGAKGMAGYIPVAYTYLARLFFEQVQDFRQSHRIQLHEYFRDKWTFHVKGLWYYLPNKKLPCLTLIGSPNFGYRSVYRDLECQIAMVTEHEGLQEQLREEHVRFYQSSVLMTDQRFQHANRYVPRWATYVTSVIKHFF